MARVKQVFISVNNTGNAVIKMSLHTWLGLMATYDSLNAFCSSLLLQAGESVGKIKSMSMYSSCKQTATLLLYLRGVGRIMCDFVLIGKQFVIQV